jgi:hypothetical protein
MGLQLLTAPVSEPISLATARDCLRLDATDQDNYITNVLIPGARAEAEAFTGRALVTQKWRLLLDRFPSWPITAPMDTYRFSVRPAWNVPRGDVLEIHIPKNPVISIDAFKYKQNPNGDLVDLTDYQWDASSEPARVMAPYGAYWPVAQWSVDAVQIDFTAGYGQPFASPVTGVPIPADIIDFMLAHIGFKYENREAQDIPKEIYNILSKRRVTAE